ncbi:alpha/beta hydrolase [Eisenbergiella sp.]
MKKETLVIWQKGEYQYPLAFGFVPNLVSYIHEEGEQARPCMLVVPGGAYCVVSPTEGEIVAMEFYEKGYNAFVLTYTTNPLMLEPLKDQPMRDLSRAIRFLRSRAGEFCIDSNRLVICGFSAGGHLSASVCVHFADIVDEAYEGISNRPDAAILSYPVITSGEKAHQGSIQALLGSDATAEELYYMSLETQVTENTPPCFLWQTATDEAVPVENSYLFAQALREKSIAFAHHVFSCGKHGLSLANEKWAAGDYGEPYTMKQTLAIAENVRNGNLAVPKEMKDSFLSQFDMSEEEKAAADQKKVNEEAVIWPALAHQWLKTVLG